MSHPTDFAPVPVPAPVPQAVVMELTIRILHPGHLWKIGLPEFLSLLADRAARETARHCGGGPGQRITVEVIPTRQGIAPALVSAPIRELLRPTPTHP